MNSTFFAFVASMILLMSFTVLFSVSAVSAGNGISGSEVADKGTTEKVIIDVPSMHCTSCPYIVEQILVNLEGVQSADAEFKSRTVAVTFDPRLTGVPAMLEALEKGGYPAGISDKE